MLIVLLWFYYPGHIFDYINLIVLLIVLLLIIIFWSLQLYNWFYCFEYLYYMTYLCLNMFSAFDIIFTIKFQNTSGPKRNLLHLWITYSHLTLYQDGFATPARSSRVISKPFIWAIVIELLLCDWPRLKLMLTSQKSGLPYLAGHSLIVSLQLLFLVSLQSVRLLFLLYHY